MTYEEVIFKFAEKKEALGVYPAPVIPGSVKLEAETDWGYSEWTPGSGAYHELTYKVEGTTLSGRPKPIDRSHDLGNDLPALLKELLELNS